MAGHNCFYIWLKSTFYAWKNSLVITFSLFRPIVFAISFCFLSVYPFYRAIWIPTVFDVTVFLTWKTGVTAQQNFKVLQI